MSLDRDWLPRSPQLGADFSTVRGHARLDGSGSLSLGLSTLEGFDANSAALSDRHRRDLAEVAERLTTLLSRMPGGQVTVAGHADRAGGEDAGVARRRAEAARAALVAAGVPAGAIRTAEDATPAVATETADPRNRRVDVRFNGEPILPGTGTALQLGHPRLVDLTPQPSSLAPALLPPFTPQHVPAPRREREREPAPARAATAGDALKALIKLPAVASWLERVKQEKKSEVEALRTGDKVVLATAGVSMATLAAVGISTDPAAAKFVLSALDGAQVEVPGAPWLKVKAITPGGSVGAGLTLELSHFLKDLR